MSKIIIKKKNIKIKPDYGVLKIYPTIENLTVTPSSVQQVFTHPNIYGYDTVTVEAVEADTLNVTPTDQSQTFVGLYGTVNVAEIPKEPEEKYINFYDYDGTRLYSYTKTELQNLTQLPAVPTKNGYTIEWNWTLPQIKSQNKPVDVGALYKSNDGKLKITMVFTDDTFDTPTLAFSMKRTSGNLVATIDWGDGTSEVVTATGNTTKNISHTYTNIQVGKPYVISLEQTNCKITFEDLALLGVYMRFITHIDTGDITTYGYRAFQSTINLETVKMNPEASLGAYSFGGASVLGFCVVPYVTGVTLNRVFQASRLYKGISLPYGITSIGDYAFDGASIRHLYIPNTVTSIGSTAFRGCGNLTSIVLPNSITSIGSNAFNGCSYLKEIDLSEYTDPTAIPTLLNSNAFSTIYSDSVFLVANQEMLTAFSGATNWSTYATKFQVKGS